jgi:hypothetical protein
LYPGRGLEFGMGRFQQLVMGSQELLGTSVRRGQEHLRRTDANGLQFVEVSTKHSTTSESSANSATDSVFGIAAL